MKLLFTIFLFLLIGYAFPQQADIPVNPNFTWNGESSLAINPTNPDNLVVAWMKLASLTQVTIAISHSNDKGNTWSDPVYMPHFSTSFTSADPTLIFSNDGTAYFAYIDYNKATFDSGGVYVCKSVDYGANWSYPVKAIDKSSGTDWPIDRPWLVRDETSGIFQQRLYLVTKGANDAPLPHHIYLVHSQDDGLTWSNAIKLDTDIPVGAQSNAMAVPAVTQDGSLCVSYLSYDPALSVYARNVMLKSIDGGTSFTPFIIDLLPFTSIIPSSDSLLQYSYYLGANPTVPGNLIFIYTDRRNGDWDILFSATHDGGLSWSETQRLNDDPVGNGIEQDMCWGGFSSDGKFAALWRDRRDGTTGQYSGYRIYGAYSTNGGTTFQPNFAISQTLAPQSIPIDGNDFLGVALSDTVVSGTWADKRTISSQIYFNRYYLDNSSGIGNRIKQPSESFFPVVIQSDCASLRPCMNKIRPLYKIQVFNALGIKVREELNNNTICFENFSNGFYFIILTNGDQMMSQKFILTR